MLRDARDVLTMRCRDHSAEMCDALDGRSTAGRRLGLYLHTMVCPPCRLLWKQLSIITRVLRSPESRDAASAPAAMPPQVRTRLAVHLSENPDEKI